ncbi:prevent-host-death protein [Chryseobacterium foetidum]|uniref:prevent-host-death protein n=1 Tax=Chryseobacterium foetidum TaxID=2951057 RepID=UPI0021CA09EB|nr:prevent-host-death protein [Chryseobacterium foetidum]
MNYKLVLNTKSESSNIFYNTITFDTFKINIIDRYKGIMSRNPILCDSIFKVRTLDDQLIKTREGNSRVKLKGADLETYKNLMDILNSYNYKNKLIKQKEADEDYVHFVIRIYIENYQIN